MTPFSPTLNHSFHFPIKTPTKRLSFFVSSSPPVNCNADFSISPAPILFAHTAHSSLKFSDPAFSLNIPIAHGSCLFSFKVAESGSPACPFPFIPQPASYLAPRC
jgi:hypothetical protein